MTHLLLVSEDLPFRLELKQALKERSCRVTLIDTPDGLPAALAIHKPDLIVLDFEKMPGTACVEVCKRLRTWSSIPVIASSSQAETSVKVSLLDAGVDDYIVRPVDADELLARVRAVQRRLVPRSGVTIPIMKVGGLVINFHDHSVSMNGTLLHLTHREYQLLKALVLARGQTLSYRTLLERIGGKQSINERTAIRTIARRLRAKLGDDMDQPTYILNESGLGYRFNAALPVTERAENDPPPALKSYRTGLPNNLNNGMD